MAFSNVRASLEVGYVHLVVYDGQSESSQNPDLQQYKLFTSIYYDLFLTVGK